MARLFQIGGLLSVERLPIHGSTMGELDQRRLDEYFVGLLGEEAVADWSARLGTPGICSYRRTADEATSCSYAAYALFALVPRRRLPQAGLRLIVYRGLDAGVRRDAGRGARPPRSSASASRSPGGLSSNRCRIVHWPICSPISPRSGLDGMTRKRFWDYPPAAIRELLVNAYAHRDWTRQNDIRLVVFGDRMEVTSPGALPNGMTIEKVLAGQQSPRNSNMVRILRDYGLMDDRGMGIRRQVVPLMREHNGAEPRFEAHEDYFRVVLPKGSEVGGPAT